MQRFLILALAPLLVSGCIVVRDGSGDDGFFGDNDGDRRGIGRARALCIEEARDRDFDVRGIEDIDREDDEITIVMELERDDDDYSAECVYDRDDDDIDFDAEEEGGFFS